VLFLLSVTVDVSFIYAVTRCETVVLRWWAAHSSAAGFQWRRHWWVV